MIKRKNRQAQEENRYQIAEYLKNKKGTQKEASEIFGISLKTVSNVWKKYKSGGKKALSSKKRGVKGGKKITAKQAWEIRELIKRQASRPIKASIRVMDKGGCTRTYPAQIWDRTQQMASWAVFEILGFYASKTHPQSL